MSKPIKYYSVAPFGLGSRVESLTRSIATLSDRRATEQAGGVTASALPDEIKAVREKLNEIEEWLNMEGPTK